MINYAKFMSLIFMLLIASIVRLWNIESNPAWYTDEGTHIEIARHLINEEINYFGISSSYLIAARLPLFEHLLAFWFRLAGVSMFSLRLLTSFLGILTVALIYRLTQTATNHNGFSMSSMALFAIYPQAVIYSRFGFSYNLLSIFLLLSIWSLLKFYQTGQNRYLILSSLALGLGTISDFITFGFIPALIVSTFIIRQKATWIPIMVTLLPFLIYALIQIMIQADIFLHDLTYTLSRTGNLPLVTQVENVIKNIHVLLTDTWWIPLGMIGLFLIPFRYFRWILILFTIPTILIIGRTIALYNLSAYYMIPFLPFVAIGVSATITFGIPHILFKYPLFSKRLSLLSILLVVLIQTILLLNQATTAFYTGTEHFLISSETARKIQLFTNDYTKNNQLIISSPTLAWMFDNPTTEFQLSGLASGHDSVHFPANLYPIRFHYEVNYRNASYAIIDNLWRDWGAVHIQSVQTMLDDIQDNWTLIYQNESIRIYQNPSA